MISLEEAHKLIDERVEPLPAQKLSLFEACGCELTSSVTSKIDVPDYAVAKVEGIALRLSDLKGAGQWIVPFCSEDTAESVAAQLPAKKAIPISQGYKLPNGANVVLAESDCEVKGDCIIIDTKPSRWLNCSAKGANIQKGAILYSPGTILKPVDISVLSATGVSTVEGTPQPEIAILAAYPPENLNNPSIPRAARDTLPLLSCLNWDSYSKVKIEQLRDYTSNIISTTLKRLADHPLVIAAVDTDSLTVFGERLLSIPGFSTEVIFSGVEVYPGSSATLMRLVPESNAKKKRSSKPYWILSLEGDPLELMMGYYQYIRKILARLNGRFYNPVKVNATLAEEIDIPVEQLRVIGVKLIDGTRGPRVRPVGGLDSRHVSSIAGLDGFIYLDKDQGKIPAGSNVEVEWI